MVLLKFLNGVRCRAAAAAEPLALDPLCKAHPAYDVLLQSTDPAAVAAATTGKAAEGDKGHQEKEPDRELTALSGSDLSPLQPFELDEAAEEGEASQVAERLKDRGNVLFKLGDTDAAAEMFTRVLRTLEPSPVIGEPCCVLHEV